MPVTFYCMPRSIPALLILLMLAGCTTVPETGRSQLVLISASEENQLGLSEFEKLKKTTPISKDTDKISQLEQVGKRIATVAPLPNARWEFVLFDQPDALNAFCLPGGKIGVYSGILTVTQDEAGLATVIAHEAAHAVARHGSERLSQGLLVQMGGAVLATALQSKPEATQKLIQGAYGIGSTVGIILPHSRDQELEADRIGLLYMARAGFDPQAAVAFWKRFSDYNQRHGNNPIAFLSTHPLDERRIAKLQVIMPQAEAEYRRTVGR